MRPKIVVRAPQISGADAASVANYICYTWRKALPRRTHLWLDALVDCPHERAAGDYAEIALRETIAKGAQSYG